MVNINKDRKIILSADSACDLGKEYKERYNLTYYPFYIIEGNSQYRDGEDITPDDIYRIYYEKKIIPKTASVGVWEYSEYFKRFVDMGYEVIHINLSSELSSAYQNCVRAAEEVGNVYPIDSKNLSVGFGELVIEVSKLINKGMNIQDIIKEAENIKKRISMSFILNTLDFMKAGGRCSTVTALGANLLKIKPCIEVNNQTGNMNVGKKYRGDIDKVVVNYIDDMLLSKTNIDLDSVFIVHSGVDKKLLDIAKNTVKKGLNLKDISVFRANCTISSHCGPNSIGISFITK